MGSHCSAALLHCSAAAHHLCCHCCQRHDDRVALARSRVQVRRQLLHAAFRGLGTKLCVPPRITDLPPCCDRVLPRGGCLCLCEVLGLTQLGASVGGRRAGGAELCTRGGQRGLQVLEFGGGTLAAERKQVGKLLLPRSAGSQLAL